MIKLDFKIILSYPHGLRLPENLICVLKAWQKV